MKCHCPFIAMSSGRSGECLYIDETFQCDEIEINPGNSDAWCHRMVSQGMDATYPVEDGVIISLGIRGESVKLELTKSRYTDNNRLALILNHVDSGELWCVLTVNMPNDSLEEGEFFVKTWSENADTTTALIEQTNLFENTGRIVPAGYANACVWKFKSPETLSQMREN